MTILQAIKQQCDNDFFISKDYEARTYRDACMRFHNRIIKPAVQLNWCANDCEGLRIYCEGLQRDLFSSEKNTLVYKLYVCSSVSAEFYISVSAIPNKIRNGWDIRVSHNTCNRNGSILITKDIEKYVCELKLDELNNKIQELQCEVNDITKFLSKKKNSLTTQEPTL